MKLKPKKELEQLLEAEYLEQEALAEQEAQRTVSPYRTDEDISYRLDVPRDVNGLVELLEERKGYLQDLDAPKFVVTPAAKRAALLGGLGSIAMAFGLAYYKIQSMTPDWPFLAFLAPSIIVIAVGYGLSGKNFYKRKKEFQQQKEVNAPLIEEIDQKLSHYQTKYSAEDILFLDDKELGYCLGDVVVEKEERVLRQRYVVETPYDGYRSYTRTKAIIDEEIICVLNPKEKLSVDDLLSLDSQTPVLWQDGDYGFFQRQRKDLELEFIISTQQEFLISTQKGLYITERMNSYTFQQIESGEITPRLLVPEIKSRII